MKTLITSALTFTGHGYFVQRLTESHPDLRRVTTPKEWLELESLLDRLKVGDFDASVELLGLMQSTTDWRLKWTAITVLGHAAPPNVFREMRKELEGITPNAFGRFADEDVDLTLAYCAAFASWGRADVIPVLLDRYLHLKLYAATELSVLPITMGLLMHNDLGTMVSSEPPEHMLDAYLALVMHEYDTLVQKLGSNKVIVYGGAERSIVNIAERLATPPLEYLNNRVRALRAMFEPATGINCSAMFIEGKGAQAAAAAKLARTFLDSPEAANFVSGRRYFWGHPIPD